MRRLLFVAAAFVAAAALPAAVAQPAGGWATVKGQIVIPEKDAVPARPPLNVTQDQANCLRKGPLLDEQLVVNPKNRGIKNVVVWLRPTGNNPKAKLTANEIHPDDQKRQAAVVPIDQPCCMFTPRITIARVGDTLVVKNTDMVAHNFFWTSANCGNYNPNIPAGSEFKFPTPLVLETTPIQYKCSIHPWMTGYVRIFDHPYYAVTDDDGKFTMPNAPAGNYSLVVWHEKVGYLGGAPGRFGTPIEIKGPTTELKAMPFPGL